MRTKERIAQRFSPIIMTDVIVYDFDDKIEWCFDLEYSLAMEETGRINVDLNWLRITSGIIKIDSKTISINIDDNLPTLNSYLAKQFEDDILDKCISDFKIREREEMV